MPKGKKYGGRVAGTPNRATTDSRYAIKQFIEGNIEELQGWLQQVAKDDPKEAFKLFMSVVEYHVPKLARTEHSGQENKPIEISVTWLDSK